MPLTPMLSPTPLLPLATLKLWLTPIWLFSLGVALGLIVLALLWGLLWLVSRKAATAATTAVSESVLMPMLYLAAGLAALAMAAFPQMPTDEVLDSLQRLSAVGEKQLSVTLDPRTEEQALEVNLIADEVVRYEIQSDQDIRIAQNEGETYTSKSAFIVQGDEPYTWNTKSKRGRNLIDEVKQIYLTNEGDSPAEVALTFFSEVQMPEVHRVPLIAGTVVAIPGLYLLIVWLLPNIANISAATAKEAVSQPLFLLFTIGGSVALLLFIYLSYNTFGEDVKILKDSGMSLIMILSIIFAVWTASVSVADEIEGKTALTLLSKPISRRQFILGKYLGILWPVLLIFVLLGAVLLATVSYKVVYDARETSNPTPDWQLCNAEMMSTVPGLTLAFLEVSILTAISVAISTRLPMLPNLLICGSIFALGHLTPSIVNSSAGENPFVAYFGRFISVIIPMLDHLSIQGAIAANQPVPFAYLGWATLYAITYIAAAILVALTLFEDRDLA